MTSLIWAPEDCHVVEFNELSAYEKPGRSSTMMTQWGKSKKGELVFVEPSTQSGGKMTVPMKEVLEALDLLEVLKDDVDINQISTAAKRYLKAERLNRMNMKGGKRRRK